jgi:hypothetical protein
MGLQASEKTVNECFEKFHGNISLENFNVLYKKIS